MINGRGQYDCSLVTDATPCTSNQPLSQFKFTSGKTYRLRLVNAGAEGFEYFTIDGHTLTVIANDFSPVEPYNTTVVTLGVSVVCRLRFDEIPSNFFLQVGQRTDVLVYASGNPTDSFWMRANNSLVCGRSDNGTGLAEIHYESSNSTKQPESSPWPFVDGGRCNNVTLFLDPHHQSHSNVLRRTLLRQRSPTSPLQGPQSRHLHKSSRSTRPLMQPDTRSGRSMTPVFAETTTPPSYCSPTKETTRTLSIRTGMSTTSETMPRCG